MKLVTAEQYSAASYLERMLWLETGVIYEDSWGHLYFHHVNLPGNLVRVPYDDAIPYLD